jgi:hypothetical protein
MMPFFFMVALVCRSGIIYGTVLVVVVEEAVEGDETVGIVGSVAVGPTVPVIGATLGAGTGAQAPTPRLAISVESSGIPARALGVADAEVGVDDEATLVAPEPHIPENPAVTAIPEVDDNPEVADIPDEIIVCMPGAPGAMDAVAGGEIPFSVTPPPS